MLVNNPGGTMVACSQHLADAMVMHFHGRINPVI